MPCDLSILLQSLQSSTQLSLLGSSRVLLQSFVGGCVQHPSHLLVIVLSRYHHCGVTLVSRQDHFILQASQLLQGLPLLLGQVVLRRLDMPEDPPYPSPEILSIFFTQLSCSFLYCSYGVYHRKHGWSWCWD